MAVATFGKGEGYAWLWFCPNVRVIIPNIVYVLIPTNISIRGGNIKK